MGLFSKKKEKAETRTPGAEKSVPKSLDQGLEKTKESVLKKLSRAVAGKSRVDDEVLDNLEEILITSDVGVDTTLQIIERIEKRVSRDKYLGTDELNRILREEIAALLAEQPAAEGTGFSLEGLPRPYVIMAVGVNGVGKTTTIAKLAYHYKKNGYQVVLGAADTFRAAAIDQLQVWADRVDVPLVKQQMGADPASVVFDTLQAANDYQPPAGTCSEYFGYGEGKDVVYQLTVTQDMLDAVANISAE